MKAADKIAAAIREDPSRALGVNPDKLRGNAAAEQAVFEALKRLQQQKRMEREGKAPTPVATVVPTPKVAPKTDPAPAKPFVRRVIDSTRLGPDEGADRIVVLRASNRPKAPPAQPAYRATSAQSTARKATPTPTQPNRATAAPPVQTSAIAGANRFAQEFIGYVILICIVVAWVMLTRLW